MSLKVVDELTTPGCPQCAIKHLSAALMYMITPGRHGFAARSKVWMAVARINLAEVLVGYESHLWYAVGMLQRSEETALAEGSSYTIARHARLLLEEKGLAGAAEALREINLGALFEDDEMCEAHLYEATRELPSLLVYPLTPEPEYLVKEIERVRSEFFVTDQEVAVDTSEEVAGKGGEEAMATKKAAKKAPAFLKKEDPKAKKAACKGGKCKKCK